MASGPQASGGTQASEEDFEVTRERVRPYLLYPRGLSLLGPASLGGPHQGTMGADGLEQGLGQRRPHVCWVCV